MQAKWYRVMLLSLLCLVAAAFGAGKKPASKTLSAPEIKDYKKWMIANPQSSPMNARTAVMCAAPSSASAPFRSSHPKTKGKFVRVFVNEKGLAAMFKAKNPQFPEGSVIVKEKLPTANSTKPEILTVMIKQRAGYDPKKGDWEYLVTDGSGKKVYQRGQLPKCQSCHVAQSKNDYLFRSYMPGFSQ